MAHTFYLLQPDFTTGPYYWAQCQVDGSPPGAQVGYGWTVDTVASGYSKWWQQQVQLSSTFQGTTTLTGPPANNSGAMSGDSWRTGTGSSSGTGTPQTFTETIPAGDWHFNLSVMAAYGAHGQRGHLRIRVWADTDPGAATARELTSGAVTGSECPAINSTYTPYSAPIVWSAPSITLTGEYLFFDFEWVIDVAGGATGSDVVFYTGADCNITTPVPPDSIPDATGLITGSPIFGTPTAVQHTNYSLTATSKTTGSLIFGTPALAQVPKNCVATSVTLGRPIFGAPHLNESTQTIPGAVSIITGNPIFMRPALGKLFAISSATNIVVADPIFGAPTAAQLPTHLTTGSPIFGQPTLFQTHNLVPPIISVQGPIYGAVLGRPIFGLSKVHQIISSVIAGAYLPSNIEKGAKGGPRFNTSLFIGANGAEYRSVNWPRSVGTWSLALGFREEGRDNYEDFEQLLSLFYAVRGNGYGFLFKDWADYTAVAQPMAPIPNSGGAMQLQKVYTAGAASYARKITRPVANSLVVTLAGVPQMGISYSLNGGVVLGASSQMLASFNFYVPVRFDVDSLEVDVEIDGLVNCPTISLTEILE